MNEYFYYILIAYILWSIIMISLGIVSWKQLVNIEKELNEISLIKQTNMRNIR